MKITIGPLTISMNEKAMKEAKSKDKFIGELVNSHKDMGVPVESLEKAFSEAYDKIVKPKK